MINSTPAALRVDGEDLHGIAVIVFVVYDIRWMALVGCRHADDGHGFRFQQRLEIHKSSTIPLNA